MAVTTHRGVLLRDRILIEPVSPGLFSANGDGIGAALGSVQRVTEDGTATEEKAYECGAEARSCVAVPIDLGAETDTVTVQLAATGLRGQTDVSALAVRIGDELAEVTALQPSGSAAGVDIVTVKLPRALTGRGEVDVVLTAGERSTNAVQINLK